ncbi:MAG TPA: PEGA domain-containing protein [Vicinamibacterales bacterium]|nr:PEGA domain-containing protein [Vicinamibacterales bacterium]
MTRPTHLRAAPLERASQPATTPGSDGSGHDLQGIDEFSTESSGGLRHDPPPAPGPDELGLVPSVVQPLVPATPTPPATRDGLTPVELGAPRPELTQVSWLQRRWVAVALAALVAIQAPFLAYWGLRSAGVVGAATGTLAIETDPAGLDVIVDGRAVGRSPIELALPEGMRSVVLKQGALSRTVAVKVTRGETVRHRFEFVAPAAPLAASGTLQITSDPSRAALVVDGVTRGVTPLTLPDLAAGAHTIAVRFAGATVEQRVDVVQGNTASVHIVAPQPSATAAGWLAVDVASPLQIFEQDKLVGTTNIGRLLLPPGQHVLDFVSDELGFRAQRTVTVRSGAATDIRLDLPAVTLSVNAQPWAEVFVDGERVGETPIGTLSRPVGRHEIVLRHPELGERRRTVTLTTNGPNRISVDMRRP